MSSGGCLLRRSSFFAANLSPVRHYSSAVCFSTMFTLLVLFTYCHSMLYRSAVADIFHF